MNIPRFYRPFVSLTISCGNSRRDCPHNHKHTQDLTVKLQSGARGEQRLGVNTLRGSSTMEPMGVWPVWACLGIGLVGTKAVGLGTFVPSSYEPREENSPIPTMHTSRHAGGSGVKEYSNTGKPQAQTARWGRGRGWEGTENRKHGGGPAGYSQTTSPRPQNPETGVKCNNPIPTAQQPTTLKPPRD